MKVKPSTILIVDDDRGVIEQLLTHFRRRGYEPIATADPTTVQQTLESFEVHLILLDLRMEKLNGYDVLKVLRDKKVNIPVLIITAYYNDEKERLTKLGITKEDVIEKPFRDFSKVESVINNKLKKIVAPGEVGSDYEDELYFDNKTKIIIIDDEPEIRAILIELLQPRNYEVSAFGNGKEALECIKNSKNDYHIAIVDMAIPGVPGHKVIEEIQKVNRNIRFIPVSASYQDKIKEALKSIGF